MDIEYVIRQAILLETATCSEWQPTNLCRDAACLRRGARLHNWPNLFRMSKRTSDLENSFRMAVILLGFEMQASWFRADMGTSLHVSAVRTVRSSSNDS